MTIATMGRRIKNFDIVYFPAGLLRLGSAASWRPQSRTNRRSLAKLLQIVDNHHVAGRDPVFTTQLLPTCAPRVTVFTWTVLSFRQRKPAPGPETR